MALKMFQAQIKLLRFLFLLIVIYGEVEHVYGVWPMPQQITQSTERYLLNPRVFALSYANDSMAQSGCSVLDVAFKRYFKLIFPDFAHGTGRDKSLRFGNTLRFYGELYVASIQQKYLNSISCSVKLGLESFSQLVYQDDSSAYFVNKTEIEDYPRFQFRGLLLDTSRHYLPVNSILSTLDAMAYSKFNVFHWHIVDDPSFPYQSSTYPDLSNKGAFHPMTHIYTQSDVRRVIAHARLRGIRVLPEFDSPGHTLSWGKGQPDFLTPCYKGDVPSGSFGPLNPTLSSSYQFMSDLFKEVTSVFHDSHVHLGGDEVDFTCWKSNPKVQAFMAKMGFGSDYTKLESYYMENILNITAALNKISIVWQDVFDYHEHIPKDTVLEIWRGTPAEIRAELGRITLAGHRVLLSAPWYLNHISYGQDWRNAYTVQPQNFSGTEQQKELVIGGEVCMWGEYVDATNLVSRLWPRACAAAERLWSNEKKTSSVERAFPRLKDFRCTLVRYCVLTIAEC
uniref:Beta-hexosaminidase n=1 Tax=Electrophorus electricus TaxID=8005 RepID=A0AAY5EGA9_ELEEL